MKMFDTWYQVALAKEVGQPYDMAIAAIDGSDYPAIAPVRMYRHDDTGLGFLVDPRSGIAKCIQHHNHVSALFFWEEGDWRVRLSGMAELLDDNTLDRLEKHSGYSHKVMSMSSAPGRPVAGRDAMIQSMETTKGACPRASVDARAREYFTGYWIHPSKMEFINMNEGCQHDRIRYQKNDKGVWDHQRLMP